MLVRQRMQALGDHAKSSRQPPLKERKYAQADESAAEDDVTDQNASANGIAPESAATESIVHDDPAQAVMLHENGDDSAAAEIALKEEAKELAEAIGAAETLPQPSVTDDRAAQPNAAREDDEISATKRAVLHEWENWSALHSDELGDPSAGTSFFRHLQQKKPRLLNFAADDKWQIVREWLVKEGRLGHG